jgi:hypothetical protein
MGIPTRSAAASALTAIAVLRFCVCGPRFPVALFPETCAMSSPTCPKCRTEMQEGFIPDRAQYHVFVNSWLAGRPELRFLGGIQFRRRDLRPIVTYRCPACGYLESFAP